MYKISLIILLVALLVQACGNLEPEPTPVKIVFNLKNAKAIIIKEPNTANGRAASSNQTNLFKIDEDGNISSVIDSISINFARAFSSGLYVETSDYRKFYVLMDNSFTEITEEVGTYKGENENGDLVFSDVSVLRANSITIEKLQTTLDAPKVQTVSGNLAMITDFSIYQVYNTVTGIRYNVNGCNGPRIEAFPNNELVLIDDCSNDVLLDMQSGNRVQADILGWNHETLRVSDGIIVLSQAFPSETNSADFGLGHIDYEGNLTLISDRVFKPGSDACFNCSKGNTVLFGGDDFLVLRELNKISLVKRKENNTITTILEGYNVTKLSLSNNGVYYLAEDNLGNALTGIYNIITNENQILEKGVPYNDIQVLGKRL